MKKTIKNKQYNTETAQFLGGFPIKDINYKFYKTKSGEYFIHSEKSEMNENILPVELVELLDFLELNKENYVDVDGVRLGAGTEAEFIKMNINQEKVRKNLELSPSSYKKLELLKISSGRTITRIIDDAIHEYFKNAF